MKSVVTTKGQVTIPKALREQFGIKPGVQVDFVAFKDGIRLRKVINRQVQDSMLGYLKRELSERSSAEWLDELRGPVELPSSVHRPRGKRK